MLYDGLCTAIDETGPDLIALEKLFFKQNVTTGIAVAQARGVIALAAPQRSIPKPADALALAICGAHAASR